MAEKYKVSLGIRVLRGANEEIIVQEEYFFNDIIFSKMANVCDAFYELIAKLEKLK